MMKTLRGVVLSRVIATAPATGATPDMAAANFRVVRPWRRVATLFGALLATVLLTLAGSVQPAHAGLHGWFTYKNAADGECLTEYYDGNSDRSLVFFSGCAGINAQKWYLRDEAGGTMALKSGYTGRCITTDRWSDDNPSLTTTDCEWAADHSQLWIYGKHRLNGTMYYSFEARDGGCLGLWAGTAGLSGCTRNAVQLFT